MKRLHKLTRWMTKQVTKRLKEGGDNLEALLTKMSKQYSALFEAAAPAMFMPMIDGVQKSTDYWFPTVKATPETMNLFDTAVQENLKSVKSIPEDHIERIRTAVRDNPGDTQMLVTELSAATGRTMRQVKRSAVGLTNNLYQEVAVEKAKATGASVGIWIHSNGSKDPRHKHQEASGHEFDLNTMLFLTGPLKGKGAGMTDRDNIPVKPGEAYGCKCTFKLKIDFGVQ